MGLVVVVVVDDLACFGVGRIGKGLSAALLLGYEVLHRVQIMTLGVLRLVEAATAAADAQTAC